MTGKTDLRRSLRAARRRFVDGLAPALRDAHQQRIADAVAAETGAGPIAAYLAVGAEVDVMPAIERLAAAGFDTALPHVEGREDVMRFLLWRPGDPIVAGPLGLLQPDTHAAEVAPAVILTPLLGFDRALRRIGQGAGHYDRAFARHPAALRIGIAWSVQETADIPMDPWDVPLHRLITEAETIAAEEHR